MKLKPFKAHIPDLSKIESYDSFFASVSEDYLDKYASKYFIPQDENAIYIYKITSPIGVYHALIGTNELDDIKQGNIIPHETTLSFKEDRLKSLLMRRQAQIKPILCAFDCPDSILNFIENKTSEKPAILTIPFEWTNEIHQLWKIEKSNDIQSLVTTFSKDVPHVFIADGHHRVTSILQLNEANSGTDLPSPDGLLTIYLPFRELRIYDYNRIITRKEHYDRDWIIDRLSSIGTLQKMEGKLAHPESGNIQVCIGVTWYELTWEVPFTLDQIAPLDIDYFNKYIIHQALEIDVEYFSQKITFVPGIHGREGLMRTMAASNYSIGFLFAPISQQQLKTRAQSGFPLPPKSTWFEPRIKNGLVVYPFL